MSNELMFSEALLRPAPARSADAEFALAAIERLEAAARGDRAALERLRAELTAAARAVSDAKAALQALAIKPDGDADGKAAELKAADPRTGELSALLDELEHRIDAMAETAGAGRSSAQAPARPPRSEPVAPPETAAPETAAPETAAPATPTATSGGETAVEPEAPPPSTPLPANSMDRVPTVSAVVSQLGRAADPVEPGRAGVLEVPPMQTAAERGIPTVSMLEALVEALTAPDKAQTRESARPETAALESMLPAMELGPGAPDSAAMPDLIEERAQEISQSFAPDGEAFEGDDAVQTAALEMGDVAEPEAADPDVAEAAALDGSGAAGFDAAAISPAPDIAGLDGQTPEQGDENSAAAEFAAGEFAASESAGDGAADHPGAFAASGATEPLPDTMSEPIPDSMPEPLQPGEDLLSSFARTEEFPYMPPDDIGTAVIFSATPAPGDAPPELLEAEAEENAGVSDAGLPDSAREAAEEPAQTVALEPAPDTAEFEPGDTIADQAGVSGEMPPGFEKWAVEPASGETSAVNWPLADAALGAGADAEAVDAAPPGADAQDLSPHAQGLPAYAAAPDPAPLAAGPERRFPRLPPAPPHDPLAPLKTMSEEEKIALFS